MTPLIVRVFVVGLIGIAGAGRLGWIDPTSALVLSAAFWGVCLLLAGGVRDDG